MSLRDDALLLCGFIYGVDKAMPIAIRRAIERIHTPDHIADVMQKVEIHQVIAPAPKIEPVIHQVAIPDSVQTLDTSADHVQKQPEITIEDVLTAELPPEKKPRKQRAPLTEEQKEKLRDNLKKAALARQAKKANPIIPEEIPDSLPTTSVPPAKPKPYDMDRLLTDQNEYAGTRPRDDSFLTDADWLDIRHRHATLNHSNTSIAGDYAVTEREMDTFIRMQKHKEKLAAEASTKTGEE